MFKNIFLLFLIGILSSSSFSQTDYSELKKFKIKKKSCKECEEKVLEVSNFLLDEPVDITLKKINGGEFIFKWMSKTSDYTFQIDDFGVSVSENNKLFINVYFAALIKATLDNKPLKGDVGAIKLETAKLLVDYISQKNNNIIIDDYIKGLLEANAEGKLEKYINN